MSVLEVLTETTVVEVIEGDTTVIEVITAGPQGPPGLSIRGTYDTLDDLIAAHPVGSASDAYIVAGDLYVWLNDEWTNVGHVLGSAVAANITFTPAGTLASTNVQAAIEEAVTEYLANEAAESAARIAADAAEASTRATNDTAEATARAAADTAHAGAADPHTGYQQESEKAQPSGYAGLDGAGKVPTGQLPAFNLGESFVVASQVAMLALVASVGDVAIRSDLNKSFILHALPASTLGNWQELLTPTDAVLSVNGETGAISLTAADIPFATPGGMTAVDVQAGIEELLDALDVQASEMNWLDTDAQKLLYLCDLSGVLPVDDIFEDIAALEETSSGFGLLTLRLKRGVYRFTRDWFLSQMTIDVIGQPGVIFEADFPNGWVSIATAAHSGSTVTITTNSPHGLSVGDRVAIDAVTDYLAQGFSENGTNTRLNSVYYNGSFLVTSVADSTHLTYTAVVAPVTPGDNGTGICGRSMIGMQVCREMTFRDIFFQGNPAKPPVALMQMVSVGTVNDVVQSEELQLIRCRFGGDKYLAPSTYRNGDTARHGLLLNGRNNGSDKLLIERFWGESLYSCVTIDQIQSVWSTFRDFRASHSSYGIRTASNLHVDKMQNNGITVCEVQANGAAQPDFNDWDSENCAGLYFDVPHIQGGITITGAGQWLLLTSGRTTPYLGSVALCRAPIKMSDHLVNFVTLTGGARPKILVRGAPSAISVQSSLVGAFTLENTKGLTYDDLDVQAGTDAAGIQVTLDAPGMFLRKMLTNNEALVSGNRWGIDGVLGLEDADVYTEIGSSGVAEVRAEFLTGDVIPLATERLYVPSDIPDLAAWYGSDVGVTLNGSNASGWADQSGNGFNLAQALAPSQPLVVANWYNGRQGLLFDGSNDWMETAAQILAGATEATIFIVFDRDQTDLSITRTILDVNGTGSNGLAVDPILAAATDRVALGIGTGSAFNTSAAAVSPGDGPFILMALLKNGETPSLYLDGVFKGAAGGNLALAGVAQAKTFVGAQGGTQRWHKGHLGDLAIWPRKLETFEQIRMLRYFGRRWRGSPYLSERDLPYKAGAGVVALADADFDPAFAPINGAAGVTHNSTTGKSYLTVRANGTWKSVEVNA